MMTIKQMLKAGCVAGLTMACATVSHAQGGSCKDPWINQAYNALYHRAPSGSGATGECNPAMYGGGHWTTFLDLEEKIIRVRGRATALQAAPPATVSSSSAFHLDRNLNIVNSSGAIIAPAGSFNLIKSNGVAIAPAAIVAQGGGNIVAQGGGNIVAQGGGNLRSVLSVERPTYVVK